MNKRKIFIFVLLSALFFYGIIYKIVIIPLCLNNENIITNIILGVFLVLSIVFLGFERNYLSPQKKKMIKSMGLGIVVSFLIMYLIGCLSGLNKNMYSLELTNILKNIISPMINIILIELLRYVLIRSNRNNMVIVFIVTLVLTILEISLNLSRIIEVRFDKLFILITTKVVPIILKNLLLTYLCFYIGYKSTIIYRLITELYVFIVPIVPDLNDFLISTMGVISPLLIYVFVAKYVAKDENSEEKVYLKDKMQILNIPLTIFVIFVIVLVSRVFPVFIMGVGSESMTGAINKCDAIIAYEVKKEDIKIGDILVFEGNGRTLIHRVVDIEEIDGHTYYRTKGDVNNAIDNVDLEYDNIYGKVAFRIPYIAYPSVWISEMQKK